MLPNANAARTGRGCLAAVADLAPRGCPPRRPCWRRTRRPPGWPPPPAHGRHSVPRSTQIGAGGPSRSPSARSIRAPGARAPGTARSGLSTKTLLLSRSRRRGYSFLAESAMRPTGLSSHGRQRRIVVVLTKNTTSGAGLAPAPPVRERLLDGRALNSMNRRIQVVVLTRGAGCPVAAVQAASSGEPQQPSGGRCRYRS